jgi:hypothetical protein
MHGKVKMRSDKTEIYTEYESDNLQIFTGVQDMFFGQGQSFMGTFLSTSICG